MITLHVRVTPFDDYIPGHTIELNFNQEQIDLIKTAAVSMGKLMKELNYSSLPYKGYILRGIDIMMPVAEWKGEELFYKMPDTIVKVFSESFLVFGYTDGLNVLIESKEINLMELGVSKKATIGGNF